MQKYTLTSLDFQGHPIRVVDRLVPVNDIADILGRDRKSVRNLVDRDPVLSGMASGVIITLEVGPRETTCLPYDGVLLLLAKLNASRSRTVEARNFLIEFQRWAAKTLRAAMTGEPTSPLVIDRRPRLSGAFIARTREQVGFHGTTEVLERIWPEWFANLPGPKPQGPQQVVTPALGLVEPVKFELRQVQP